MCKPYSWKSVDPNAWVDVDLTALCDMGEEERLAFLGSLTFEQKTTVFNLKKRLTNLVNGREDTFFYRKKKKLRHLKKNPGKVFWDYAEYYGGEEQVNGFLKGCLVSTRGDVVWLDRVKQKLQVYPSNEKGKKKEVKAVKLLGVAKPYDVDRLVACTFVNTPNRYKHARDLTVLHSNGYNNNNNYTNLEWKDVEGVKLEPITYCVTIMTPGLFCGSQFMVKYKNLLKYGFSKKEIKNGFTGYHVYPKGCKISRLPKKYLKHLDFSQHSVLINYLKSGTFKEDVVYDPEYENAI